jgi:hypothetical protein
MRSRIPYAWIRVALVQEDMEWRIDNMEIADSKSQ